MDPELAVSSTGGRLTQRIHRVLGYRIVENDWQSAIAALLFVVVWVTFGAWQSGSSLDASSLVPRPVPAPIEFESAATTPKLAGAMNAIAAIVTAEPVQPVEPQQSAQSAQSTAVEKTQTGEIEGVLRDDLGRPAEGFRVLAIAVPTDTGAAIRSEMLFLAPANARTDSGGRYRLENIPAGPYYILAGPIGLPTLYPGTLDAGGGKVVTVPAGATVRNIDFALASMSFGPITRSRPPFSTTGPGTLTLYVSIQVEGGGKIPIFANGRFPRLRLTKVDTNVRYEMGLGSVAIAVPRNNTNTPDEYKVAVEDLPEGYTVKSITYRADEPGLRFEDVLHGTLKISARANYSAYAGNPDAVGAPDLPIAITLTAPTKFPSDIRVTGTSEGMIAAPHIPSVGGSLPTDAGNPPDAGVYLSGKPGVLFADGTFEFGAVSPGLYRIVLYTLPVDGPRVAVADVIVRPGDRIIRDVPLQIVPVLPKTIFSPPVLSARATQLAVVALPSLTVRVLDEATQQPIVSGYTTLTGVSGSLRTYVGTSTPILRIPALLPGEYSLTAESYGYTSKTQTVTVGYGDPTLDITIARIPR